MSDQITKTNDPKTPTREQLTKWLPNHEAIKIMERLFQVAGSLLPEDVANIYATIEEVEIQAGIADTKAVEGLDMSVKNRTISKSNEVLLWLSIQ